MDSVVMGNSSYTRGDYSTALGNNSTTSGSYSIVMGNNYSYAGGDYSMVLGNASETEGTYSIAFGSNVTAQSYGELVVGQYNVVQGDTGDWNTADDLFVVGNGTSSGALSDAFVVKKNGDVYVSGTSSRTGRRLEFQFTDHCRRHHKWWRAGRCWIWLASNRHIFTGARLFIDGNR